MFRALRTLVRNNDFLRGALVPILASHCNVPAEAEWLICPMYHDFRHGQERRFATQLRYMKSLGDFVGLDDAIRLLDSGKLGGRYFCVTVDDGYWGAYHHGYPVLAEADISAAFFVVPAWLDDEELSGREAHRRFINWDECRTLAMHGVTIGSHSQSHARLAELGPEQAFEQMIFSRYRIEAELATACYHFASPWGQPGTDFLPARDPSQARAAGYKSFLTTIRARAASDTSPFVLPRIRVEPNWGTDQLKYMFFR
jgi:peptidoglycan/xylan/chitin deacetylase (PgdA/CDA1 family)